MFDKTVLGALHFPLLIKPLSYVLIIHLNHKMSEACLLYTTYRLLLLYTTNNPFLYFDHILSIAYLIYYSKNL